MQLVLFGIGRDHLPSGLASHEREHRLYVRISWNAGKAAAGKDNKFARGYSIVRKREREVLKRRNRGSDVNVDSELLQAQRVLSCALN